MLLRLARLRLLIVLLAHIAAGQSAMSLMRGEQFEAMLTQARARGLADDGWLMVVSVADQRLALISARTPPRQFTVSTSKWGVGAREDSNQTPTGWHRVTDWIGGDTRPGQVFVARQPTDQILPPAAWRNDQSGDFVLTRILWLDGLENGTNRGAGVDSRSRFIYLHGTNQEHLLGQPASHGCIRLANRDIMELFDLTRDRPTYCWIVPGPLASAW